MTAEVAPTPVSNRMLGVNGQFTEAVPVEPLLLELLLPVLDPLPLVLPMDVVLPLGQKAPAFAGTERL
jgi:hypothetical protein